MVGPRNSPSVLSDISATTRVRKQLGSPLFGAVGSLRQVLVGSSGSRGLGSPLELQHQLPVVMVTALCHSAVGSTPRAVD